jgi:DNA-binding PadR family transcriptional regulator
MVMNLHDCERCGRASISTNTRPEALGFASHRGGGASAGGGDRPWWIDAMGEPPPRAERGIVRYLILEAIEAQPRHGYEIIQHIKAQAGAAYRPSPGVIYPTLQLLEDLGHAQAATREERKVYVITEAGKQELDANRRAVREFYASFSGGAWLSKGGDVRDLVKIVGRVMKALKTATLRGGIAPAKIEVVRQLLEDVHKKIEETLDDAE